MAWSGTARYQQVFAIRSYRRFWLGFAASVLGDAMTRVALTWLVYEETDSARALGWLTLCFTGPIVVGGLLAGMLLDRFDRRTVMMVDNLIRGVAVASIPLLAATDRLELWHVYVVAAIYGLLMMISLAGGPALIPSLVPREHLSTANALEMLGFTIGGVAGPAIAGLLIVSIGAANVVIVDAVSYGLFAFALLSIRRPSADAESADGSHPAYRLSDAVRLLLGNRILLTTTLMFLAFNVGGGMIAVWLPLLADRTLDGGAGLFGALLATIAIGEIAAVILAGTVAPARPLGTLICVAQLLSGISLVIVLATRTIWGAAIGLALYGALSAPLTIWAQTLRMEIIPERLRGRAFALLRMLMQGGTPLGGTAGGLLAPVVGIPALIGLSALLITGPGVIGYQVEDLRVAGPPLALGAATGDD